MRFVQAILFVLALRGGLIDPPHAVGQDRDVRFERVENEAGPSHNSINAITQDRQGFLWIGTDDGLNRYDGYDFVVYRHDPSDTTSVASNTILTVLEDHAGRLWVGSNGGLDRFDRTLGQFQHYDLLDPIMHDHPNAKPLFTNEQSDEDELSKSSSFSCFKPYPGESDDDELVVDDVKPK